MPRARYLTAAIGVVLLVLLVAEVATQYEPHTWIFRDARFYVNVNENILLEGSFEDPFAHSWYNGELGWNRNLPASFSNIALGKDGEYYHFRPYLLPMLSTPFYWAFGLFGTLLFNVLSFLLMGLALFRFVREYADEVTAACATAVFILATGVQMAIYHYSVDVLLLTLFAGTLAALASGRGFVAGLLFAAALTIKPTTLLYALPILLLFLERRDRRGILHAIAGGAVYLAIAAAINTHMYGRPWWFGYNHVLTVVDGHQVVVSDVDAFTTPFEDGFRRLWDGHWGLRRHYVVYLLGIPGMLVLLGRRPLYALGAVGSLGAAIVVFSHFDYEGDRFLYPAFALALPAVALGLKLLGQLGGATMAALSRRSPRPGAAVAAALLVAFAAAAGLARGGTIDERLGDVPYVLGARALAEEGTLDLSSLGGMEERLGGERSVATLSRYGHWLPRTNPLAVVAAAPFWALGGKAGLFLLHLLAAALAAFAATRALRRVAPPAVAAVTVVGVTLLSPLNGAIVLGGAPLFAAAALMAALWAGTSRRWATAAALGALGAWLGDAPWLLGLAVLAPAFVEGRQSFRRALLGGGLVLALWCLGHLWLIGWPFASPEDFVAVWVGDHAEAFAVPGVGFGEVLRRSVAEAGGGRALLPLLFLAPMGLFAAARDRPLVLMLGALLLSLPWAAVHPGTTGWSPTALFALALPLAPLGRAAGDALGRAASRLQSPRRIAVAVGVSLAVLGAVGGLRLALAASEPFRIASFSGVRHAAVHLEHIPCDFLAWENMSWECSNFDGGRIGRAGLALPERFRVDGQRSEMLIIPTGRHGRRGRSVSWESVDVGPHLHLRYGSPDEYPKGVRVVLRVDGEEADRFDVGPDTAGVMTREVDTGRWSGRSAPFAIEVSPLHRGRQTALAIDGGWDASPPRD